MDINVLLIDDDTRLLEQLKEILHNKVIDDNILKIQVANFIEGLELIEKMDFDFIILDLCKGDPKQPESEKIGLEVLEKIKSSSFVMIIFFTGLPSYVEELKSEIIGVINKGDGTDALINEIKRILDTGHILLKKQVAGIAKESLRRFFWEFVHPEKNTIEMIKDEVSLGYLLLRRLANSLSKEQIKILLNDDKIRPDKVHPMEFYIYPLIKEDEFELGDIIEIAEVKYIILTSSCDLILRTDGKRKAGKILLARAKPFNEFDDYGTYMSLKSKEERTDEEEKGIKI